MVEIRDRRDSSWFWLDKAILDTHGAKIGPYGIAVYALLARHADNKGHAFPSLKAMVRVLGMSRQSVVRTLDVLVNAGLISKGYRKSEQGDHASNIYTLLHVEIGTSPQDLPHKSNDVHFQNGTSPQDLPTSTEELRVRPHVDHGTSPRRLEQDPLNKTYSEQEKNVSAIAAVKAERYPPGFLKFWAAYPKKIGKDGAGRKWKSLHLEALTDTIVASVHAHIAHDKNWRDTQYVPNPETYLNQGRWKDEFSTGPPAAQRRSGVVL
jgi:hypothetical protein